MHQFVKDLVEQSSPFSKVKAGDRIVHPSGRTVQITSGQYWGTHGLSNFWYWREVLADGSLGEEENGYGWDFDEESKVSKPPQYKIVLSEEDYQTLLSELSSLYNYHWNDDHIHANDCGSKVIDKIRNAELVND